MLDTARTHTTGGRENGVSRSSDGHLQVQLSVPGTNRAGTNPEQPFAAGWSAFFESARGIAARQRKIVLAEIAIDAEVDLHLGDSGYFLSARLNVDLPGLDRAVARQLIEDAEGLCPYSKAVRGDIEATITQV